MRWLWKEGRRWNPVPAHSLLFLKSTKVDARLNVPIRRTNRYQQYYMPSQHTYFLEFGNHSWQSPFTFLPVLTFIKFISLPIYRLPTLLSATKEGFNTPWTWCFPCTSDAAPVTQPGTTRIHNRGPKYYNNTEPFHVLTTLIVLSSPNLHIEMVTYCMSYSSNRTCQIAYQPWTARQVN